MSDRISLEVEVETWPFAQPYRFAGHVWTTLDFLVITAHRDGLRGRGEGAGVYYHDDVPRQMPAQIDAVRDAVGAGAGREELLSLLPPGGARNALDCALWDLEAKRAGQPVWALAGLPPPRALPCIFTLSIDDPAAMAAAAVAAGAYTALKLKITGDPDDGERVRAVRAARPDAWLGVDANQSLTLASLDRLLPVLADCRVELLEQPLPVGFEADLDGLSSPVPIGADESVQTTDDLARLPGRFQVVNIKLDKCGGLTEALRMAREARRLGLTPMVGNMLGTSRAMAPGFMVGQLCDVVDLDGPLLVGSDVDPAVTYEGGRIFSDDRVWGGAA